MAYAVGRNVVHALWQCEPRLAFLDLGLTCSDIILARVRAGALRT